MNSHTIALLRDLRPGDAERVDELFPPARRSELLAAITSAGSGENVNARPGRTTHRARRTRTSHRLRAPRTTHRARPRSGERARLRRGAVLSALGATAAGAIAAVALSTTSAVDPMPAQAVTFRDAPSGDILATVTDPFAAQAQLNAAFAQQGLKITVNLIPVSPSIVGTVLFVGESGPGVAQIKPLQGGHCLTGGGGCPVGIEIPRDFTGEGSITLGRPARSGERYESSASIFAPGEPLHCSGLLGAKVAAALPILQSHGLVVTQWREDLETPPGVSHSVTDTQPPLDNYIWGAELYEPGKVGVTTASTPWPDDPGAGSGFNKGC